MSIAGGEKMRRQKGAWRASYRDTWNLDRTLADIILAGLIKFKEVKDSNKGEWFGVPGALCSEDKPFEESCQQWVEILEKMIYAFDYTNEPDLIDYNFEFITNRGERDERGLTPMSISYSNKEEYARYRADEEKWLIDQQEGFDLFGKYFRNLWW
jgi:hypothetical protein